MCELMDGAPRYLNAVASVLKIDGDGFYCFREEFGGKRLTGNWTPENSFKAIWAFRGTRAYQTELETAVAVKLNDPMPDATLAQADLETLVGRFLSGAGPKGTCFTIDCSEMPSVPGETPEQLMRRFYRFVWDTRAMRPYAAELQMYVSANLKEPEKVNHPAHYGEGVYETINVINAMGWGRAFCLGNALKYLMRAGDKPGESEADDIRKAIRYLEMHLEQIEVRDGQV